MLTILASDTQVTANTTVTLGNLGLMVLLLLLFVIAPMITDKAGRMVAVVVAAILLWVMIATVPLAQWTAWATWADNHWWVMLVAVVVLVALSFTTKGRRD